MSSEHSGDDVMGTWVISVPQFSGLDLGSESAQLNWLDRLISPVKLNQVVARCIRFINLANHAFIQLNCATESFIWEEWYVIDLSTLHSTPIISHYTVCWSLFINYNKQVHLLKTNWCTSNQILFWNGKLNLPAKNTALHSQYMQHQLLVLQHVRGYQLRSSDHRTRLFSQSTELFIRMTHH